MTERYICPVCGKRTRVKTPRGGDGTLLRPVAHRDPKYVDGRLCEGRFEEAQRITESEEQSQ